MRKCHMCFAQWDQVLLRIDENEMGDKRGGNGKLVWATNECPRSNIRKGWLYSSGHAHGEQQKHLNLKDNCKRHSLFTDPQQRHPQQDQENQDAWPLCFRVHSRLPGLFFGMMRSP